MEKMARFLVIFMLIGITANSILHAQIRGDNGQVIDFETLRKKQQLGDAKRQAINDGRWLDAIQFLMDERKLVQNPPSISSAEDCLQLSMLLWNNGNRTEAKQEMQTCFNVLKNDPKFTYAGYERAKKFLEKMNNNNLPARFTREDISRSESNYLLGYIMEIPKLQWNRGITREEERYNNMQKYFRSRSISIQLQADYDASQAVKSADYDYYIETKMDFDLNKRPENPSALRAWESCKRIHEIFCK